MQYIEGYITKVVSVKPSQICRLIHAAEEDII